MTQRSLLVATIACVFAASSFAHDDDPKILDLQPPYMGAGYRPGALLPGAPEAAAAQLGGYAGDGETLGGTIRFPSSGVRLLSWIPVPDFGEGPGGGNDCWGYVSPSGREYALIGLSMGTGVVEVTDPSAPVIVTVVDGPNSLWRDVKTYQTYAYAVSEGGGGIQVIDLSNVDGGEAMVVNTILTGGIESTHNVAIDETSGYLYRTGGNSRGLRVYSLANPANPTYVGQWNSRYVHDAQIVTYTSGPYAGRQIAFCCAGFNNGWSQTGLTILDVTNKNSMFVRAHLQYSINRYSHQGWLSPDRQYFYLGDELDENGTRPSTTYVIDVSDLDNPVEVDTITNGNQAITHNLYTLGDRMYAANYRSGLRVFEFDTPTTANEIAWFDTYPSDDWDAFNGLWNVYPFLPSGIVFGSDLEKGLFVWWVGDPLVEIAYPSGIPDIVSPDGDSLVVQIDELNPGDLDASSPRLFYDDGAGWVESPLASLGGGAFRADFPALPCGTELRWFVGARSTNGILWADPPEAPYTANQALVATSETVVFEDDMEQDRGWISGDTTDGANAGFFERGDPIGSMAQPEDDHTPGGSLCWITDVTSTGVNGGKVTLFTPTFDLADMHDPVMSFWFWFFKEAGSTGSDKFKVDLTNDGGVTWNEVEYMQHNGRTTLGSWRYRRYHIADYVTLTNQIQVRFRVNDGGLSDEIEAAVDDFKISEADCGCGQERFCVTSPNSAGAGALMSASGSHVVSENAFELAVTGAVPGQVGFFYYAPSETQVPLGNGFRCIAPGGVGIFRLLPLVGADPSGSATRPVDFTRPPADTGPGAITAGSTWKFQYWYRDPGVGAGYNLSDGMSVDFCP